jgi:hypothetical protein
MKKAVTKIAVLLLFICTSYFRFEAKACVCDAQGSPYGEYQQSRAVFVGKPIGSKDQMVKEKDENRSFTVHERVFEFSVTETLKGPKTPRVQINAGSVDSDCYRGFTIGESYLVYAFGDSNDSLSSSFCGRTNELVDAAGDLHYIRNLLKSIPEPRFYGSIVRVDSDLGGTQSRRRVTPLAGIKIVIEGKSGSFESVSNDLGLFSLDRIPDGRYKARPVLPKKYMAYFPTYEEFILGSEQQWDYVRIQRGPSAYASFQIGWNNHLNGRVVDSEGNPIKRDHLLLSEYY